MDDNHTTCKPCKNHALMATMDPNKRVCNVCWQVFIAKRKEPDDAPRKNRVLEIETELLQWVDKLKEATAAHHRGMTSLAAFHIRRLSDELDTGGTKSDAPK